MRCQLARENAGLSPTEMADVRRVACEAVGNVSTALSEQVTALAFRPSWKACVYPFSPNYLFYRIAVQIDQPDVTW